MLGGFAIATLLLNTPASIVALRRLPLRAARGLRRGQRAERRASRRSRRWVDFQAAQDDIFDWDLSGAEEWAHLIVSGILWLVIPLGLGLWRILRAEVK